MVRIVVDTTMWETVGGGHPLWMRTGTQSAIPDTRVSREWDMLHYKLVDMNKAVNVRHPSARHRTKTWWKVSEGKEREEMLVTIRITKGRSKTVYRYCGNFGRSTCRIQRWLWMRPCEGWQWWETVRNLRVREEVGPERARLLSSLRAPLFLR